MSDITVIKKDQRILVDPASQTVSVATIGPQGIQGPIGPTGPPGAGQIFTGGVVSVNQAAGSAFVRLASAHGGGLVAAKVFGGVPIWPYATCRLVHDGTYYVILGCEGRSVGFRDDFTHINVVGGIMHSDLAWLQGNNGSGGSVGQGLYGGQEQFGMVSMTGAAVANSWNVFRTPLDAIGIPWFTTGGLWVHTRLIVGSGRPNNQTAFRIGMMDEQFSSWSALNADSRGVMAVFHPSYHATNWLLEIGNGLATNSFATTVAVTDQTVYDIDLLWLPRSVANAKGGFAGLWIDGTLRASATNDANIPEAFTTGTNAMTIGATMAMTSNASRGIMIDSIEARSVSPCTIVS